MKMKKKRKESEASGRSSNLPEISKSHHSLERRSRLNKRCREDRGVATVPPSRGASLLLTPSRGLKRKIGCIDKATQMGRSMRIEDDYVTGGSAIGQGKFGSVTVCRARANGAEHACKTLRKGEETVHREVEIMQHVSGHPGVVTLEAVYEDDERWHLVMELCSGGRLVDRMKEGPCSEHVAAGVLKEVMLVVKYCHDMGVVHRDIKPENVLLTGSGKIKLADFGLAIRISEGQNLTGVAGSPAYVAPEVLSGRYSEKVDIWSSGVLLHALLVGGLPFKGGSPEAVFEEIKNVKLDFQTGVWESISKPARDLVGRMLTRDVSARIAADEVLRHPWILFYTERTLKMLPFKSKLKLQNAAASATESGLGGNKIDDDGSLDEDYSSPFSSSESCNSENHEDCVWIDALSTAVSRVRISETKRTKLWGPTTTSPLDQQGSSNMKTNLCKAF
ncbi:serine/threonine-protein kinase PEPKR2-like [Glycine soja]|uniref:Serine/threonine-protein kinase PEPKR2 isoform A n=1 Tax=Glycine soja TaxID=3848 RepID=A0A445H8I0_GLYSO|nr:serine/threonine-protein kinase PEPKR2-like [Glycine soja]RZB69571.1 Serine/threonine-protein kinase PEPKR2 isoform A [Glycine soja]RZB69573.1 Serine/threonine-protein kinase PEPKR2 isoform C [Glycine soja]